MKILVTGATGFLGRRLVQALVSLNHHVLSYKRSETAAYDLEGVEWFSLRARGEERPFRQHQIDAIIHTATCYGRQGEPVPTLLQANMLLPVQLANLAVMHKVPLFINTDSYFNLGDEGSTLLRDYSLSKCHALHWLKRCTAGTSLSLVNLRLEHMYGPGDRPEKFCSHVLSAMARHESELLLTSGQQKRDFIYVDDVVGAFIKVLIGSGPAPGKNCEYGVGWGASIPIRQFIILGHKLANSRTKLYFGALPDRPEDFADSRANNEALRKLGWKPQVDLEEGIARTLASYKSILPSYVKGGGH